MTGFSFYSFKLVSRSFGYGMVFRWDDAAVGLGGMSDFGSIALREIFDGLSCFGWVAAPVQLVALGYVARTLGLVSI